MKTDTCPHCQGTRRVGFFGAYCVTCDTVQPTPEIEAFKTASMRFREEVVKSFAVIAPVIRRIHEILHHPYRDGQWDVRVGAKPMRITRRNGRVRITKR